MQLRYILAAATAATLAVPGAADAAFPGENGPIYAGIHSEAEQSGLFRVGVDADPVRLLTTGAMTPQGVEISPDGKRAVWHNQDFELWTAGVDGESPRRLPSGGPAFYPSWSPDGTRIVFSVRTQDGEEVDWELWTMNADGTGAAALGGGGVRGIEPAYAPDGRTIAYTRQSGDVAQVALIDATGTGEYVELAEGSQPEWTPDGASLVFTRGLTRGDAELKRIDLESGRVTDVTDPEARALYAGASVAPDGTRLVAYEMRGARDDRGVPQGRAGLVTMTLDGQDITPLPKTALANAPDWASAGAAEQPPPDEEDEEQPPKDDKPRDGGKQDQPQGGGPEPQAPVQRSAAQASRTCASRRFFTINVRGKGLRAVAIRVNGRAVRATRRSRSAFRARVDLRTLPKGRFTVRITKTLAGGKTRAETRRYRTCTPRRR